MTKLLEVEDLTVSFTIGDEKIPAVEGVSLQIARGEILALVGESGSGKSVTARSIMGLVRGEGLQVTGTVCFNGENLLEKKEREMNKIRGNEISMVYQEPMSSLNPHLTIGDQVAEALRIHRRISKKAAREEAVRMMGLVGIAEAEERYDAYPAQFSGGMRQRIMIAMALICEPRLLIADEPTTALDVTVQAEILLLLKQFIEIRDLAMLLITHDLGVVADMADRVCVMYCGKIMEMAEKTDLFQHPLNPYTQGLIRCIPAMEGAESPLYTIGGSVPHPTEYPQGCRFSGRCPNRMDRCREAVPPLVEEKTGHWVSCWLYDRGEAGK